VCATSASAISTRCITATTGGRGSRGAGLTSAALRSAAGEAASEKALPLVAHFLVEAVGDKDKESLEWGDQGHKDKQDDIQDINLRQNCIEEGKEPGQTDGYEDGHKHTELFAVLTLFGLRSLGERAVDLRRDEKEEDSVDANEDEARQEKQAENEHGVADIARSVDGGSQAIFVHRACDDDCNARDAPADQMVKLLQLASARIALHNHLVEIEGDTAAPNEVGQKEVMYDSAKRCTKNGLRHVW